MKKLIAYIALVLCVCNSCTTQAAVHFGFKQSLVNASSVTLNRLSRIPLKHGIKIGGHVVKTGLSTTYSVCSYMLTGKMKWVTLIAALYIYAAWRGARTNREIVRAAEALNQVPVEPIAPMSPRAPIHLSEMVNLPPAVGNLPRREVILPVEPLQQAHVPGASLFNSEEERREYLAARV
jgi:hypothetical protein